MFKSYKNISWSKREKNGQNNFPLCHHVKGGRRAGQLASSQRQRASDSISAVQGSVEKKVSYELATALADTYRDVVQREFYDQLNLSMPVAVSPRPSVS